MTRMILELLGAFAFMSAVHIGKDHWTLLRGWVLPILCTAAGFMMFGAARHFP